MKLRLCFLVAMLACRRETADRSPTSVEPQPQAEVTSAPPAKGPSSSDDVAIATRWVEALRDADQPGLSASTVYPFELHDASSTCKEQTASSPEQLSTVLACLSNDPVLIDVLRKHDSAAIEPLPSARLGSWARKWHVSAVPGMRIVTAFFDRRDARAQLDLWVVDGGVRGVWKSGVNGSREIQLATEWLSAVKKRDVERLAKVTSYPFEVRDTRRDAACGKRTAKSRDTLPAAVDCLFQSELLHRALVDSPSTRLLANEPTDSLPEWIEPWWREKEHRGLLRVFALVATNEGHEFDLQMLIARDGVRVVWKLGSLESRD